MGGNARELEALASTKCTDRKDRRAARLTVQFEASAEKCLALPSRSNSLDRGERVCSRFAGPSRRPGRLSSLNIEAILDEFPPFPPADAFRLVRLLGYWEPQRCSRTKVSFLRFKTFMDNGPLILVSRNAA
jgi:hypothetical protein